MGIDNLTNQSDCSVGNKERDSELDQADAYGSLNIQPWQSVFRSWRYMYVDPNNSSGQQSLAVEKKLVGILAERIPANFRSMVADRIILGQGLPTRIRRFLRGVGPTTLEEVADSIIEFLRQQQAGVEQRQSDWRAKVGEEEWKKMMEERRQALGIDAGDESDYL